MIVVKFKQRLLPPPKVIAVDVDGTLVVRGVVNKKLTDWCKHKKQEGFTMILWSSRGETHAINAAKLSGLCNVFDHIISKPGYIVDDKGWSWVRYTKWIRWFDDV